jgi:hypothetical protein
MVTASFEPLLTIFSWTGGKSGSSSLSTSVQSFAQKFAQKFDQKSPIILLGMNPPFRRPLTAML